ncbi:MAG: GspE/PulE family protein [Sterolibacterium sp.]
MKDAAACLGEQNPATEPVVELPRLELLSVTAMTEQELPTSYPLPPGVTLDLLRSHCLLPLAVEEERCTFAVALPPPLAVLDALRQRLGVSIGIRIARREDILQCLQAPVATGGLAEPGADAVLSAWSSDEMSQDLDVLKAQAQDAPVVKLAQELLFDSIDARASDLHLEIFQNEFRVRARIDGILLDRPSPPRRLYLPLISHLKLRAQMNIAERRLPQDGRIKLVRDGREVDCRVSTIPTVHGESMAIRLLDQGHALISMADLGLSTAARALLEDTISLPHGMILVTGPTGSGKTTSLYAMLGTLNNSRNKIITVEDPVEYQISGVNQIQVKPLIDLTFANALKAIVRQDPDILMVGEIRDRDTAEIAIQSALTGHLVLSTLHTNDAAGAPHRLLNMGVEPYLIASSVVLIVAQRLVRTLCPECRKFHPITQADRLFLNQHGLFIDQQELAAATGCAKCGGTGYLGRLGIFELLPVSEAIKEAILRKESTSAMRRLAHAEGHGSLYADGLQKVLAGMTTLEELARVARIDAQLEDASA